MRVLGTSSVALDPIATYPDSVVYRLLGGSHSLVFKGHDADGRDRDWIAAEADALRRSKEAGVPVPDVVEVDTSATTFPGSYFVMTAARAVPLDTLAPGEVATFAPAVGDVLRRLHTATVSTDQPSWREFVTAAIPAALDYLGRLPAEILDVAPRALRDRRTRSCCRARSTRAAARRSRREPRLR
jgi:hypothetical protein